MSARAMFKAQLALGEHTLPVKLYAAARQGGVSFRLLHAKDEVPIEQRMVHPDTGEVVPSEDVTRGAVTASGDIVKLDPEELAALEPEPSRTMEILRTVDPDEVEEHAHLRPYYLGPDGRADAYRTWVAALERAERWPLVRWTMRKRTYVGVMAPHGGALLVTTLRPPQELVAASSVPAPPAEAPGKKEEQLAGQLVDALAGDFEPEDLEDEFRARVEELVEAKRSGKTKPLKKKKPKQPPKGDLEEILERSLAQAG